MSKTQLHLKFFFRLGQAALISYSHMIFSRRLFWSQLNNLFQRLYILKYSLEETETPSVPTSGKTAPNHEVGGVIFITELQNVNACLSTTTSERRENTHTKIPATIIAPSQPHSNTAQRDYKNMHGTQLTPGKITA